MGCLSCINKTFLYVLNLILFGIGIGVIVTASLTFSEFGDLISSEAFTLPIIVLIVGIFIVLLGFFGCCGAQKENSCMLYTYSSVLIVLIIAQVTCGILLLVYKDSAEDFIKGGMEDVFNNFNSETDPDFTNALNKAQHKLECCGVYGPNDWKNATHMDGLSVPDGCCVNMVTDCGKDYFDHANTVPIYEEGCYVAIKDDLLGLGLGISGLILAGAGIQLVIAILACCLAKKNKD